MQEKAHFAAFTVGEANFDARRYQSNPVGPTVTTVGRPCFNHHSTMVVDFASRSIFSLCKNPEKMVPKNSPTAIQKGVQRLHIIYGMLISLLLDRHWFVVFVVFLLLLVFG